VSEERELLALALIALEDAHLHCDKFQDEDARLSVIEQTKELLAQPEPMSGKYWYGKGIEDAKFFLKRKPLSDTEIFDLWIVSSVKHIYDLVRSVEKVHGIGEIDE